MACCKASSAARYSCAAWWTKPRLESTAAYCGCFVPKPLAATPYSRITWDLPAAGGNYKAFRTQYAIDGLAPYADVTVRVKLDGKTVHERTGFTAGELSPVVLVPLNNAKQLTLEVDFGGNYNVQDRLNWIEPALITATAIPSSPAPAPTATKSPAATQSSQPAPAAQ